MYNGYNHLVKVHRTIAKLFFPILFYITSLLCYIQIVYNYIKLHHCTWICRDENEERTVIKARQTRNERVASCDKDVKERGGGPLVRRAQTKQTGLSCPLSTPHWAIHRLKESEALCVCALCFKPWFFSRLHSKGLLTTK